MAELGRLLLIFGAVLLLLGAVLLFAGKFHLPFGRLPGDFVYRGKNTTVYFPLATSLVLSVVLTLLMWLFGRSRN